MNSKELYVSLNAIASGAMFDNRLTTPRPNGFEREVLVHMSYGNGNKTTLSYVAIEYVGIRSKFFCCLTFDGEGNYSTNIHNFAMPSVKLNPRQKALATLAVLQFLIDDGYLAADFSNFRERIESDINGGANGMLDAYDAMYRESQTFVSINASN